MRRKVLIVEDHKMNRAFLKSILEGEYDVIEAGDGLEAMQILAADAESISAVLLDICMPKLDGYGVLEQMRNHPDMKYIPVIVATVYSDEDSEGKALVAGANDYVTKPYIPSILLNRLKISLICVKTQLL